ncbi:MAG: phage holin family protein, partial [Nocardioides sp.]
PRQSPCETSHVKRFLIWLATTTIALAAASWIMDGIRFTGSSSGSAELQAKLVPLLLVALILGVVTSFVKPVLRVLAFPFIIVTLGLFLLVINAALLLLTGKLASLLDIGFRVDGFWTAVGGAIVITLVTWVVDGVLGSDDKV